MGPTAPLPVFREGIATEMCRSVILFERCLGCYIVLNGMSWLTQLFLQTHLALHTRIDGAECVP